MRAFTVSFLFFALAALAAPIAEPAPVAAAAEAVDARGPPNANAWCGGRACSAYV